METTSLPALAWTGVTNSPEETQALGAALGAELHGGEVLLLSGSLGAGKTTLTQGIARGLGVKGYTKSPSFVLVNEYHGRLPLYHMDLFRIEGGAEAWELGLEDYLREPGVIVVEWAERALRVFPPDRLRIHLEVSGEKERRLTFAAEGPASAALLERLRARWPRQAA